MKLRIVAARVNGVTRILVIHITDINTEIGIADRTTPSGIIVNLHRSKAAATIINIAKVNRRCPRSYIETRLERRIQSTLHSGVFTRLRDATETVVGYQCHVATDIKGLCGRCGYTSQKG